MNQARTSDRVQPAAISGLIEDALVTSGLPAEEIELRVFGNGQYHGRFMLTARPGARPSLQARLVAVTLADMTGRAFGAGQTARSAS